MLLAIALRFRACSFAGAWSVLNMHELAVTSGFAAAYRLGAKYPFQGDEECQRLFVLYLALSHGVRMVKFLSIAVSSAADNLVQASRGSERHSSVSASYHF